MTKTAALTLLPLALLLSACANPPPPPSAIYAWAADTVALIPHDASPSEWSALLIDAQIPRDFPFSKTRADFGDGKTPVFDIDPRNFEAVAKAGITSSIAEYCKLDYEELNFLPLMQWQRSQLPESAQYGYEIYVLGVAHGYAMGSTDNWLQTHAIDCTTFEQSLDGQFFSQVFGSKF